MTTAVIGWGTTVVGLKIGFSGFVNNVYINQ